MPVGQSGKTSQSGKAAPAVDCSREEFFGPRAPLDCPTIPDWVDATDAFSDCNMQSGAMTEQSGNNNSRESGLYSRDRTLSTGQIRPCMTPYASHMPRIQESHCHKISPSRSSTLRGLSRTRTEGPLMIPRPCLPHHRSLHKPPSGLLHKGYQKKPRPEPSQDQRAPLLKSLLIWFNASAV